MPISLSDLSEYYDSGFENCFSFLNKTQNHVSACLLKDEVLAVRFFSTLSFEEAALLKEELSVLLSNHKIETLILAFDHRFVLNFTDSPSIIQHLISPFESLSIVIINPGALKLTLFELRKTQIFFSPNLEEAIQYTLLPAKERDLLIEEQKKLLLSLYKQASELWDDGDVKPSHFEGNALLTQLVDYLDIPLWAVDKDFKLVFFNSRYKNRFEQISQVSPIIGEANYLNLPEDFRNFIAGLYRASFEGEHVNKKITFPVYGVVYHLLFTAIPIRDKNNQVKYSLIHARDISALVDAENYAKENQQQWLDLVGNLEEGLFSTDSNLVLKSANSAFLNIRKNFTGREIKIGDSILFNLPENRKHEIEGYYRKALSGHQINYIKEIKTEEGIKIFKVRLRPQFNTLGSVSGIAGILQENTEEYLKNKLLKEEEYQFKFILENSSDVLVLVDENDRVQYASPSITKIYGYLNQEVIQKNSYAFIHPLDYEQFRNQVAISLRNLEPNGVYTVRILHKNGKAIWSDLVTHRLFDDQGRCVRGIYNIRDVSERVLHEGNLKKSQKLLESISRNIKEGLYRSTPRNGLIYVNDAFRDMFGYQDEPIALINSNSLYENPEERERLLKIVMHQGFFQNEEVVFKRLDNSTFTAQISSFKTEEENGEVYFDGVIRDITAQKQTEVVILEAKEAAERANKLKAEFLASVSHEVRTPLNGVIGMTSLLKHTELTEEQRDYVDTIKKSSDHLLSIINDILDFSKIESGYLLTENHPFELSVVLEETLDLFAAKSYEKNIELIMDINENVHEYFVGDATRLRQILVNLIGNALKFTERGEIITKVSLAPDNPYKNKDQRIKLLFSVSDTGIGIKKDDLEKLFKPFSQVDSSNTRRYGGTGLGLVISEKLVVAMGGEIDVKSEYGFGSTFTFTIELEDHQQMSKREIDYSKLNGLTALVVDDNQTNLKIVERILSQKGMHVISTTDPVKGLNTLSEGGIKIDLAIVDMQMPEMDGLTFGEQIRKTTSFKHLPIILFSSIGDFNSLSRNNQHIFNGVLTKPAKSGVILSKVMQVLYKETPLKHSLQEAQQLTEAFAIQYPSRILIAEDNLINQKLIIKLLEKMGYQPDVVANGLEVLESVNIKPYDLIFMDVQMPEMDGLEATRHLNKKRMLHKPNIVAMTANALSGDRENCLDAGMQDYVSKPVKIDEIQKMIIRWGRQADA